MFLQVSVCPQGGRAWLLVGGMHGCWLGGRVWLLAGGACMVAGRDGVRGCWLGGMRGCWQGGMHGCWGVYLAAGGAA